MEKTAFQKDVWNILFLLFLYTLQGIPLGLSSTMDLILQEKNVSFENQGIFGFVTLPFSVKLLWAPLVDSIYSNSFGRRKSWLIPVQLLLGILLILASYQLDWLLTDKSGEPRIINLTQLFLVFYFLAATQDIAVDGWAITMLRSENVGYASTCNSIGQSFGYIVAYSGFLYLKRMDLIELDMFFYLFGVIFVVSTLLIWVFITEKKIEKDEDELSLKETYSIGVKISKLASIKSLIWNLFCYKVFLACFDTLTMRKLLQNGLKKETIASLTLITTPLTIILPGLLSTVTSKTPLNVINRTFLPKLCLGVIGCVLVALSSSLNMNSWPMFIVMLVLIVLNVSLGTAVFVSSMSFFSKISDEKVGGTYMTFLNTINNLSGLMPSQISLFLVNRVDFYGVDGYFILCFVSLVIGLSWFWKFGKNLLKLENLSPKYWSVVTSA